MKNEKKSQVLHDIRNKLTLVQLKHDALSCKSKDFKTLPESEGLEETMDQIFLLLDQIHLENDHHEFQKFDVGEVLLKNSIPHYEKLEKIYKIKINLYFDSIGDDQRVLCDLEKLNKLRETIVENAFKSKATKIDILYKDFENHFEVIYTDDGEGICPKLLSQMSTLNCDEKIVDFSNIRTKLINNICKEHGFTVYSSIKKGQTTITVICPYI